MTLSQTLNSPPVKKRIALALGTLGGWAASRALNQDPFIGIAIGGVLGTVAGEFYYQPSRRQATLTKS